jgi:4-amino-4-deoxy-L-arabinose transferase-like glycosyltransferase
MEFPVMQWVYALFFKLLGPHIAISRVLTFLTGLFAVWGMYRLCFTIWKDKAVAAIGAWCFNFSPVFYYYTINPMPDTLALCLGIWSLVKASQYIGSGRLPQLVASALFLGLAALVKLPFVLFAGFIGSWYISAVYQKRLTMRQLVAVPAAYMASLLPAAVWYINVMPGWKNKGITTGVLDALQKPTELAAILWGNFSSILPELLINYGSVLFFVTGLFRVFRRAPAGRPHLTFWIVASLTILLYFLYELNMITTVHDYYLFPFLPFIFIIVAAGARTLLSGNVKWLHALAGVCLAVLPLTAFLRADSRWDTSQPEFNHAYYAYKNELRALIPPDARCITGNDDSHYITLYYIDRKGWAFDNDQLDSTMMAFYKANGARYLLTDCPADTRPDVQPYLGKLIFNKETLRVWELK